MEGCLMGLPGMRFFYCLRESMREVIYTTCGEPRYHFKRPLQNCWAKSSCSLLCSRDLAFLCSLHLCTSTCMVEGTVECALPEINFCYLPPRAHVIVDQVRKLGYIVLRIRDNIISMQ